MGNTRLEIVKIFMEWCAEYHKKSFFTKFPKIIHICLLTFQIIILKMQAWIASAEIQLVAVNCINLFFFGKIACRRN